MTREIHFDTIARHIAREVLPRVFGGELPRVISPQPEWEQRTETLKFGCQAVMMRNVQGEAEQETGNTVALDDLRRTLRAQAVGQADELFQRVMSQLKIHGLRFSADLMLQWSGSDPCDLWKKGECNFYVPIDFFADPGPTIPKDEPSPT